MPKAMAWMRSFSIRLRMQGAIAMVLTLLMLLGAAGLQGIRQVEAIGDAFVAGTHADTVTLAGLRTALGNVRRFEKDLLINYDSAAEHKTYRSKWDAALAATRDAAQRLAASHDADEAAAARRIAELLRQYAEAAAPVLRQIEVGGFNDAPVANRALGPAKQFAHQAEQQVDAVQAALDAAVAGSVRARASATARAYAMLAAALALAMLLVVPLTLANLRSICRPIDRARQLAERIATGDLASNVGDSGRDEAAQLLNALNAMQDSLRRIVGQVRQSAESIQVASAEVASGNTDLSQRTEQAASNLQQTAGSVEQLTANVRQSADAAAQANQLAASASAVAQRGGAVVGQVVSTMDEINTSSRRIADIIGTI
ncbi:MAG: HAMP domain-containing protein, partial [Burkholderiaceae bacterium]|nr:HAMP domain-containing protein [Burkholderiaceae bacterium]